MKTIVFTDLDGTLLDKHYSIEKTKPILAKLKTLKADIVFCTSKTRAEAEYYQKEADIHDPFITENGAAIYIQKNTLKLQGPIKQTCKYYIIELGTPRSEIRLRIKKIADKTGYNITGFADLNPQQIAENTGLSIDLAALATQREYTEPVLAKHFANELLEAAKEEGLRVTEGDKFKHFTGQHDKGEAVSRLRLIYAQNYREIYTVGVGNGRNDLAMLTAVEASFYIEGNRTIETTWKKVLAKVQSISKNAQTN